MGRSVQDEGWINSSISFNNWLRENGKNKTPVRDLCDTTNKTVAEAAEFVERWVKEK